MPHRFEIPTESQRGEKNVFSFDNENFHILNPRLDPNFKAIFTQPTPESRCALKSFLTAAIGRKVVDVTVVENEEPKDFDTERGIRYDINCEFDDGTLAQIEIQGEDKNHAFGKRVEYYVSRLTSSLASVGDEWDKLPQAYQISVLDFYFDKTNENPIHHYTMVDTNDGSKLPGILNVIFMELPKAVKFGKDEDIKTLPSAVKWCKFLKEADAPEKQDLINELARSEEGIMEAAKTLSKISQDRWRWIMQGRIEGEKRDYITGINAAKREGREEGAKATAIANAKNMLIDKVSPELIAKWTSLPLEQVLALKKEVAGTIDNAN